MTLTILIVTWNSWGDLKRCLESIRAAAVQDCEILVIDNGSGDGTAGRVREQFPEVRLECNATNLGLPPAVNRGLRAARGDFIMLLDVDTEIRPGTTSLLLEFLGANPQASLVAPRIYTPEGTIEQSARNLPSMTSGLFGRQSFLRRLFPNNPFTRRYLAPQNLGRTEPFPVGQVSAACMFMRRELIDQAGPWDENYRCYWVDSDWCAQVQRVGKAIYCVPAAGIVHYENNRAHKKKSPWRIRHFHIGAYRFYRKQYTRGVLDPRALMAAVALTARAGIMMLLNEIKGDSPPQARGKLTERA